MNAERVERPATHDQYASLGQQAQAVKLALAVFLASEALLFTAVLAIVTVYRADWPDAWELGVHHNTKILGSINTGVLLVSSALVAIAVEMLRANRRAAAGLLTLGTATLGVVFLVIKLTEYLRHFQDGIYPGGRGEFFLHHADRGLPAFWTLYYLATGLHALHVTIGVGVIGYRGVRAFRAGRSSHVHSLEAAALYWHLVDVIWLFLWPLFYLA